MSSSTQVRVLGEVSIEKPDGEHRSQSAPQAALLAALVAAGPTGLTTEQLLNELFDGQSSEGLKSSLRMRVSRLRKVIGEQNLPSANGRYTLLSDLDVDFWELQLIAEQAEPIAEETLARLLSGTPFPEIEPSPIVVDAVRRAQSARESLVRRLSLGPASQITDQVLAACRKMTDEDPYNEPLAELIVDAHIRARRNESARRFVERYATELASALSLPADEVCIDLREKLQRADASKIVSSAIAIPGGTHDQIVGRKESIQRGVEWLGGSNSVLLVSGPAGVGKTRFLAELAREAYDSGATISYVPAHENAQAAYGPFRTAFPELAPTIDGLVADDIDQSDLVRRARIWNTVSESLGVSSPNTVLLIFDDAQWLDSQSSIFVEYLSKSVGPDFKILIAGRAERPTGEWAKLIGTLNRDGADSIELGPLTEEDLQVLVAEVHPSSRLGLRRMFAAELLILSSGLPAVARIVAENAEPETLKHRGVVGLKSIELVVRQSASHALQVGIGAAVLGMAFSLRRLAIILEMTVDNLLAPLEALITAGHVEDTADEDQYRFRHVLVRDAFLEAATGPTLLKLNQAASIGEDNIHRRAELQDRAFPIITKEAIASTLLESANQHYSAGSYREAAAAIRRADHRLGGQTELKFQAMLASCLDRFGESGGRVRAKAFEQCLERSDWASALDVALSGLPEAEIATGDPARVALLLGVNPTSLDPADQFRHAVETCRQLAVSGDSGTAREWSNKAIELAQSPTDWADCFRANWLATVSSQSPKARLSDPRFAGKFMDEATPSAAIHVRALDLFGATRVSEVIAALETAASDPVGAADPFNWWHHLLLRGTVECATGKIAASSASSNEAMFHGHRYGIREASAAWLAQQFVTSWMTGNAGELVSAFEQSNSEVVGSVLAEAAFTVALWEAGRSEEAAELAVSVCERALTHESFAGIGALSLVSRVVGLSDLDRLKTAILRSLAPLGDSMIVVGGGFAAAGPVDMARGFLSTGSVQQQHFDSAIDLVDKSSMLGWQVATRLELGRVFAATAMNDNAARLADGTELEAYVASQIAR